LNDSNVTIHDDLMGISMLALVLSPWAMIGLSLYYFSVDFVTLNMAIGCACVLFFALPKVFELLFSYRGSRLSAIEE